MDNNLFKPIERLINKDGASTFFWLSKISLIYGLINEEEYKERLQWLSKMMYPNDDQGKGFRDLFPKHIPKEDEPERVVGETGKSESKCFPVKSRGSSWLLFIAKGNLKGWYFHQYDRDPHPSIPHGHYEKMDYPKFDPYTGWIHSAYRKSDGRISRSETAELWNDPKFRKFAYRAIAWYMSEHPNHNWRVPHPLRLPKPR